MVNAPSLLVLLLGIQQSWSHLCLFTPKQRGPLDISTSGNPSCFRHTPPCGGQPVETPTATYTAGQTAFIQWQQNYNHYEAGYPGYMDLSIAPSETSTNFTTLAVITDEYVHAQDYQRNFTAIVKIPDMACDHCVIRARYNAHKPGETPFLQCTDVTITTKPNDDNGNSLKYLPKQNPSDKRKLLPLKRALSLRKKHNIKNIVKQGQDLYGFAFNPFESQTSHYISVNTASGQTKMISTFDFGIDSYSVTEKINSLSSDTAPNSDPYFMLDEVLSVDYGRNTTTLLLYAAGEKDDPFRRIYLIGSTNGSMINDAEITPFAGGAINALSWYTYDTSVTFRIQSDQPGGFHFEVGTLDFGGTYTFRARAGPENLYVNFQWLDTDVNNYHLVYALLGNENAADALNARIYTFDIYNGNYIQMAELDVTNYTFMAMHSYPQSANLYAFSPGLWAGDEHAWYLVAVSPQTGHVQKQCDIAPPGIFQRYYGGSVYQGNINQSGVLYHVLRVQGSNADVIVSVNPVTCDITFSEPTNLRHVHSLQRVERGPFK